MLLPHGITGFADRRPDAPLPAADLAKSFTKACQIAARAELGRVERVDSANPSRSYHQAILQWQGVAIAALCNAYRPWIAFAEPSDDLPLRFIGAVALANRFRDAMDCEILGPELLEAHPDASALAGLSNVERGQVRYWRPQRIGDIIFNTWD